jgi:hypothetical protein
MSFAKCPQNRRRHPGVGLGQSGNKNSLAIKCGAVRPKIA